MSEFEAIGLVGLGRSCFFGLLLGLSLPLLPLQLGLLLLRLFILQILLHSGLLGLLVLLVLFDPLEPQLAILLGLGLGLGVLALALRSELLCLLLGHSIPLLLSLLVALLPDLGQFLQSLLSLGGSGLLFLFLRPKLLGLLLSLLLFQLL